MSQLSLQLMLRFGAIPAGVGAVVGLITQALPVHGRRSVDRVLFFLLPVGLVVWMVSPGESWLSIFWVIMYGIGLIALMLVRVGFSRRSRESAGA